MQVQFILRCAPADLINPFAPYRLPVTVCAVLLVAAAFVFGWPRPRPDAALLTRAIQLTLVVPALLALSVAGWVWLQYISWLPGCSPGRRFGRLGFEVADARILPPLVTITSIVTVVALVLAVALALIRLLSRGHRSARLP
jgi:hypothetical protein